ncbi:hypothetical protein [Aeromicrobium sp. REDSEA-S32_B7]|uniref:hypothetical protein n=1 Tax=Aeromicrobium sp. REDSEA-S32_B7 TaxID=1811526 RepID=UPI000A792E24|nr:hypothetical protein [Aeromicrobium sp. REDSEA-S32_B7]
MSAGVVAVAQWRVAPDHREAVVGVLAAGTRHVQLDVGGPGRGPILDDAVLAELCRLGVVVDALAVNRANDLGLHRDGRPTPECLDLLLATVGLARRHGVSAVHVPSFRASAIVDAPSRDATARQPARRRPRPVRLRRHLPRARRAGALGPREGTDGRASRRGRGPHPHDPRAGRRR